jgi:hypothetical protein
VRVRRTIFDRALALFQLSARYACRNPKCAWRGLRYGQANDKTLRLIVVLLILVLAWATPTCLSAVGDRLSKQPGPDETLPVVPLSD